MPAKQTESIATAEKALSAAAKPQRVLIVRAGALGDTLMVTPLIRALHEQDERTEIDFLCSAGGAEILRSNPFLARIFVLRQRNVPYWLSREKQRLVRELRGRQYTRAILLESAARYRELLERAKIAEIRTFESQGFDPAVHSAVSNLRVGGFPVPATEPLQMDFAISDAGRAAGEEALRGLPRPIVGLHAGYGPKGKKDGQVNRLRGWATENFAQVAGELLGSGASVVLTGSAEDRETCEAIARGLPQERVRILAGTTDVAGLGGVVEKLDLLISVDSGPAHMAAALGTPLIVLWGPGILHQTRPMAEKTPISILQVPVPCAPCYGTERMKACTRNICMEGITPEDVMQQARQVLGRIRSAP